VSHAARASFTPAQPLHVTVRLAAGLPGLRKKPEWDVLKRCFRAMLDRAGFRLCHYSVLNNHLHLLVEADDPKALARGMQSLLTRIAKRLNSLWSRTGRVFADRFHSHVLRTATEVRHALLYVLNNARRHGVALLGLLDRFASGGWFDGWLPSANVAAWPEDDRLVSKPGSWYLKGGWRRQGRGRGEVEGLSPYARPIGSTR
jgi:REP element-mobilizing transposase RayT